MKPAPPVTTDCRLEGLERSAPVAYVTSAAIGAV